VTRVQRKRRWARPVDTRTTLNRAWHLDMAKPDTLRPPRYR
jgi:hypothetical protein